MHEDYEDQPAFWTRPGFIVAAVLVAVVAALGIVLALTLGDDEQPTPAEVQPPPAATSSPTDNAETTAPGPGDTAQPSQPPAPAPAASGDCPDLSGADGDTAITTGPTVQWSPVGEVAAAFSEENGPTNRDGIKSCYAHTPTGALLAAYNFLADFRTWSLDPVVVAEERVSPESPSRAFFLETAAEGKADRASGETSRSPITLVGYRFLNVSKDEYTISLVFQTPGTSSALYVRDEVVVEWSQGDWLISDVALPEQVDALPPDYLQWGPTAENPE